MPPIDSSEHSGANGAGHGGLSAVDLDDSFGLVVSASAVGLLLLGRTNFVCRGISQRSRFKSFGFCLNVLSFGHDVYFNSLQFPAPRASDLAFFGQFFNQVVEVFPLILDRPCQRKLNLSAVEIVLRP